MNAMGGGACNLAQNFNGYDESGSMRPTGPWHSFCSACSTMKQRLLLCLAPLLLGATVLVPSVSAQEVHVVAGVGTVMNTDDDALKFDPAFDLRAGLTFPVMPVYLGARASHFRFDRREDSGTVSQSSFVYAAEVGFDLSLFDRLTLRPAMLIGAESGEDTVHSTKDEISWTEFYVAPSLSLLIHVTKHFTLGASATTNLNPKARGFQPMLLAGLRFP